MKFENLLELINTVSDSNLTCFKYEEDGTKISMRTDGYPLVTMQQPMQQPMASSPSFFTEPVTEEKITVAEPTGNLVKSPLVGTFYTASSEDTKAFVQVGDIVKKGQTLAIVEAMKLMNDIECDFDGTITEILVANGAAVEYGQPLFRVS